MPASAASAAFGFALSGASSAGSGFATSASAAASVVCADTTLTVGWLGIALGIAPASSSHRLLGSPAERERGVREDYFRSSSLANDGPRERSGQGRCSRGSGLTPTTRLNGLRDRHQENLAIHRKRNGF
jgi:hypothetical protein